MDEILGREFDWYALDDEGSIAMFAAGGSDKVPDVVAQSYREYDQISESIAEPRIGTSDVWLDHAELGFYVFETHMTGDSYTKVAEPAGRMNTELVQRILSLPNLPKYKIRFSKISSFDHDDFHRLK